MAVALVYDTHPVLSDAELQYTKELQQMKLSMKRFRTKIEGVRRLGHRGSDGGSGGGGQLCVCVCS